MGIFPVHGMRRYEKLHTPLLCSHIAAPGPLVCQHHVSAWAEGDGFSIGGRAVTTIPATSVLLHPGKINVQLPWVPWGSSRSPGSQKQEHTLTSRRFFRQVLWLQQQDCIE